MKLWNNEVEIQFFKEALKNFASPEQLFYKLKAGNFAYVPKGMDAEGQTLQSRNSLIDQFTEKWSKTLFEAIAKEMGLYAVNSVVCEKIGLTKRSSADLALCTKNTTTPKAEEIKLIFEIKMSIVSNYEYKPPYEIKFIGDYKQHKGNPSLLRSDSMLKAIAKAINIRVSSLSSTKIPIIILGNSPITKSYKDKVDYLKKSGVIQGFWSLNPRPTQTDFIKNTKNKGFQTIFEYQTLHKLTNDIVTSQMNYFSSMIPKKQLGEIINIASKEKSDIAKANKFLSLLNNDYER